MQLHYLYGIAINSINCITRRLKNTCYTYDMHMISLWRWCVYVSDPL